MKYCKMATIFCNDSDSCMLCPQRVAYSERNLRRYHQFKIFDESIHTKKIQDY